MTGYWVRFGAERGTETHVPRCPKAEEDSFVQENLIYHTRNLSALSPSQPQLLRADFAETSAGKQVIRMKSDLSNRDAGEFPAWYHPTRINTTRSRNRSVPLEEVSAFQERDDINEA